MWRNGVTAAVKTTQKSGKIQHPDSHTAESRRSNYLKNLHISRSALADLFAPLFPYSSRPFPLGLC
jgi:hypothetical protein